MSEAQPRTSTNQTIQLGGVELDLAGRRLVRSGQLVRLSRTEWQLLEALARHAGQVLTHRMLLNYVWGDSYSEELNYLHVYIRRLRHKLEENPAQPAFLLSEPGIGYRLALPRSRPGAHAPPAPQQPPSAPKAPPLPAPLTSFVGREREIAQLEVLLARPHVRLITILGPGGAGKTRLALEAARALSPRFDQGSRFVPLDAIQHGELLLPTIAQALGLASSGPDLARQLREALQGHELLLVLDNFEQLVDAAPQLDELLRACPQLKLLVTSRIVLQLYGEQLFALPPLSLPGTGADVGSSEAVRLFVERAGAVRDDFALSEENAASVAAICARLEGLPLAIELAAARIKRFAPEALLLHLERRLSLGGGGRNLPERHRTLRDAVAWSYGLLTPEEQALFTQLAVFAGGGTLEAAQMVCDIEMVDLDALLESLADQSLLRFTEGQDGAQRVVMLETIREFALEQLERRGEAAALHGRHLACFVALAEEAEQGLSGSDQKVWFARLRTEQPNLQAAFAWAIGQADASAGLRMVNALWRFWWTQGLVREGLHWSRALLALPAPPQDLHAKALIAAGILAWAHGDYPEALGWLKTSLAHFQALGDLRGQARALTNLGLVHSSRGAYGAARAAHERAVPIWRTLGDKLSLAAALNNLGIVAWKESDVAQAQRCHEEALALRRDLGDRSSMANSLLNLGVVAWSLRDYQQARALYEQSLALVEELGDRRGSAQALVNLGNTAYMLGDYAQAEARYRSSLPLARAIGHRPLIAAGLCGMAALAAASGSAAGASRALRLAAVGHQIHAESGGSWEPDEHELYQRALAAAAALLSEEAYAAAWSAGLALSIEAAAAEALEGADQ